LTSFLVIKLVVLAITTLVILWVSRKSLRDAKSHGFYRFFAWEAILVLFMLNLDVWFVHPWRIYQIISWILLVASLFLVIEGFRLLRIIGKPTQERTDPALIGLEKTTALVSIGLFAYIRHPLYSSLLFLGWGVFFKQPSWAGICLAVIATVFLTLTAKIEERENIAYFGDSYQTYMHRTKMFIPFLF
jgi:protein-S-isoprenylcysteine O-methyltransferase Ste14